MQVIIHTNANGGVSVTVPTGELHITQVQTKDTPSGSLIVDSSMLPQGNDALYFDAWELHDSTVSVNIAKAQIIHTNKFNAAAMVAHQTRTANTAIGLPNTLSDAQWSSNVSNNRSLIANTTTTSELVAIAMPTP
jgi:hypothetical protein